MPLPSANTSAAARAMERGRAELHGRHWRAAREAFTAATAADPHAAAAWEGLAAAALCLDEAPASRAAHERAYREYLDARDFRGAARVAIQLAVYHDAYRGELAIARGWFERAGSLLETIAPAAEHAWLAFWKAHLDIHIHGDVARGEPNLQQAIQLNGAAGAGGELDLMANGLRGLTAISEGAIDEGLRRLDAVTAAVIADEQPAVTAGWTYCYLLDACENVRDIDRAAQWMDRAFEGEREFGIRHFMGACREHYVGILTWRGDLAGAEREAETMRAEIGDVAPTFTARCDMRVGEIRRRQGRPDEAAALLEPHAAMPFAMLSLAALALDRGEPQAATDLVERYLRRVGAADRVRRFHGVELLVRAEVALGRIEPARAALEAARAVACASAPPLMRALGVELEAIVEAAAGALEPAQRLFEDAVDGFDLARAPYEAASARLRLAAVLGASGRDEAARRTLEAARAQATRIGATGVAAHAADALRPRPGPEAATAGLTSREVEVLALVAQGFSNHDIGERLFISGYTVKRHIGNILTKLDLPTRAAAAAYAIREGIAR